MNLIVKANPKIRPRLAKLILINIVILLLILAVIEFSIRYLFPNITPFGIGKNLIQEGRFGNSYGLTPNTEGYVFGAKVITDSYGFRVESSSPTPTKKHTILFLGDSISFGPSLTAANTFAFILQKLLKGCRIINTSVMGYSANDYYNILKYVINSGLEFEGVISNICLNDFADDSKTLINKSLLEDQNKIRYPNSFLQTLKHISDNYINFNMFLKEYSRTYLLLKSLATDPGKGCYLGDKLTYDLPNIKNIISDDLMKINDLAVLNGKWIVFIIWPYEYQLRDFSYHSEEIAKPQKLINEIAKNNKIIVIDFLPKFKKYLDKTGLKSKSLYIFCDPMHYSLAGHQIAAQFIYEELTKRGLVN